jgi:hypothetical protein
LKPKKRGKKKERPNAKFLLDRPEISQVIETMEDGS